MLSSSPLPPFLSYPPSSGISFLISRFGARIPDGALNNDNDLRSFFCPGRDLHLGRAGPWTHTVPWGILDRNVAPGSESAILQKRGALLGIGCPAPQEVHITAMAEDARVEFAYYVVESESSPAHGEFSNAPGTSSTPNRWGR